MDGYDVDMDMDMVWPWMLFSSCDPFIRDVLPSFRGTLPYLALPYLPTSHAPFFFPLDRVVSFLQGSYAVAFRFSCYPNSRNE